MLSFFLLKLYEYEFNKAKYFHLETIHEIKNRRNYFLNKKDKK